MRHIARRSSVGRPSGGRIAAALLVVGAALPAGDASAAEICVEAAASGGDGSRGAPFGSIVEAVAAAQPGDEIRIAGGSYDGAIDVPVANLTLAGGYAGGGDFDTHDPAAYPTLVTGGGSDVITLIDAGASRVSGMTISGGAHGIYAEGYPSTDHALTVDSCVIEGNGDPSVTGAGIYAAVPTIVRASIVRNNVGDKGAGISGEGDLTVQGSLIEGNIGHGDHGGGIYAYGDLVIEDSIVRGNRIGESAGYGWGGGLILYGQGSSGLLHGNLITGNYAPLSGSGVFIDDGAYARIQNELIVANVCPSGSGAAVYVDGVGDGVGSEVDLINVTIADHPCSGVGNALLIERDSTVTFTSSVVWANGGASFDDNGGAIVVRYSTIEGGADGEGNLASDPLLGDVAAGDYHLRSQSGRPDASGACVVDAETSPAIDAGDPAADASLEPHGGRIDMGAYGGTTLASCDPGTSTGGGGTGENTGTGAGGASGPGATSGAGGGGDGGANGGDGDGDDDGDGDGSSTAKGVGGASPAGSDGEDDGCGCTVVGAAEHARAWIALQAIAAAACALWARRRAR